MTPPLDEAARARYCTWVHPHTRPCSPMVDLEALSPRQRESLAFIVAAAEQRGVVRIHLQIGQALGIGSTNAVSDQLRALTRKGYIERVGDPGRPRSLRLTERATGFIGDDHVTVVPVLGRIAAGVPLLAEEN